MMIYYVGDLVEQVDDVLEEPISGFILSIPDGTQGQIAYANNVDGYYVVLFNGGVGSYSHDFVAQRLRRQIRPRVLKLPGVHLAGYAVTESEG